MGLGADEVEVGRWNVDSARLFIDMVPDPDFGAYVKNGSLGLLITDKSLRGSFYEGRAGSTELSLLKGKFILYWPYDLVAKVCSCTPVARQLHGAKSFLSAKSCVAEGSCTMPIVAALSVKTPAGPMTTWSMSAPFSPTGTACRKASLRRGAAS